MIDLRCRVVVADDRDVARDLMCGVMLRSGHAVYATTGGDDLPTRVVGLRPDIVLLSPEGCPSGCAERVRALAPAAPVVLVAPDPAEPATWSLCLELGMPSLERSLALPWLNGWVLGAGGCRAARRPRGTPRPAGGRGAAERPTTPPAALGEVLRAAGTGLCLRGVLVCVAVAERRRMLLAAQWGDVPRRDVSLWAAGAASAGGPCSGVVGAGDGQCLAAIAVPLDGALSGVVIGFDAPERVFGEPDMGSLGEYAGAIGWALRDDAGRHADTGQTCWCLPPHRP